MDVGSIQVRDVDAQDRVWVRSLIRQRWGADFVVAHGVSYSPHKLAGLAAVDSSGDALGLLTYVIADHALEIVTLNSLSEGRGVGAALLSAVKEKALAATCERIWLITTNDNLHAVRFYQKRGFRLVAVHLDALEITRRIKPSLPEVSAEGIPMRDELELEFSLQRCCMDKSRDSTSVSTQETGVPLPE